MTLVAKLDNVKNITSLLKAIHFNELATCFLSSNGIKVTVEEAHCVQANAFIQAAIFQEYSCKEDGEIFTINLTVLLECLSIFGNSSPNTTAAMKMCYNGYGNPLILMLEENEVLTDCNIQTQESSEILDFNFLSTNVINKIIMKSECLKEAFSELDMTSEVIEILMSPTTPYFRLSTFGDYGDIHFDYPKDSEMVESFECRQLQINKYKITLIKPSVKALTLSSKISIRMDNRGFLSLQFMIQNDDNQISFVEYLCAPNEDDENDE
ncbi:Cell cycle checkpoint protein RAD1 [Trichoplax sp. H2]|nr:Cell cycle checkpoint protein RAD1 [Trichoplax sp. H2]|eukprot:RDD42886.1 Cell cycle checkpoint protein RAD1 [Trichoplax sp. H2]